MKGNKSCHTKIRANGHKGAIKMKLQRAATTEIQVLMIIINNVLTQSPGQWR